MSSSTDLVQSPESLQSAKNVTWSVDDGGIAVITFDLPDSKVNTLGKVSMTQLNDAVEAIRKDSRVKGLVLASGKGDNFIAGADVHEIQMLQHASEVEVYEASKMGKAVFENIENLPFPSVAAINGMCLGGGTEMALSCKYRIASKKVKIGLPEVKLGFVPGWGGCVRLPKLVGLQQALGLIMEGKVLDGRKAWKAGIVDEVVDAENLMARAKEVAGGAHPKRAGRNFKDSLMALVLEKNPVGLNILRKEAYKAMMRATKGKYPAPKEALNIMVKSQSMPREKAFELESTTFARLASSNVSRNLVGIFFAQTESKKMPQGITEKPSIATVGVMGAGVMGAGIAQACANAGYKVVLKDIEERFLDKGRQTIAGLFDKLVERKKMTREEADNIVNAITFTTDYAAMSDCDLVIEAVLEDLELKKRALAELDQVIKKKYVFATNTSSLSVTQIAEGTEDPGKVVGLHFFNPVHKMPLVEIVRGQKTSNEAIAAAMTVALKLDKTTVLTNDAPGFVVNRILAPYLREAAVLAEEGVPIPDIDKAMKNFGMPMGPMVLLDEIGLDIAAKVIHVMNAALGERMAPPPFMSKIETLQLLGKKGGKGIYTYNEKGKPDEVNPDVQALIGESNNKKLAGDIQDRLVLLMVNEAVRCLEEKVVEDPAQLDLGMIFGTGFAPFTGGPLKYTDQEGVRMVYDKLEYLSRVHGERYKPCALLKQMAESRGSFYSAKATATA